MRTMATPQSITSKTGRQPSALSPQNQKRLLSNALHTQSFNWLFIHSTTPFRTFEHLNETYIYKPVNYLINPHTDLTNEDYPIRVTSLSQTIIDCIRHIDLAGGLEELMNALDLIGKKTNHSNSRAIQLHGDHHPVTLATLSKAHKSDNTV